jgi:hypothetical protein
MLNTNSNQLQLVLELISKPAILVPGEYRAFPLYGSFLTNIRIERLSDNHWPSRRGVGAVLAQQEARAPGRACVIERRKGKCT